MKCIANIDLANSSNNGTLNYYTSANEIKFNIKIPSTTTNPYLDFTGLITRTSEVLTKDENDIITYSLDCSCLYSLEIGSMNIKVKGDNSYESSLINFNLLVALNSSCKMTIEYDSNFDFNIKKATSSLKLEGVETLNGGFEIDDEGNAYLMDGYFSGDVNLTDEGSNSKLIIKTKTYIGSQQVETSQTRVFGNNLSVELLNDDKVYMNFGLFRGIPSIILSDNSSYSNINSSDIYVNDNSLGTAESKWTYLLNKTNYSTREKPIGTWFDGKTIYRKVINIGDFSTIVGQKTIAHSISNLDTCIKCDVAWYFEYNGCWYMQWQDVTNIHVDSQYIRITTTYAADFTRAFAIMEYTKTTD